MYKARMHKEYVKPVQPQTVKGKRTQEAASEQKQLQHLCAYKCVHAVLFYAFSFYFMRGHFNSAFVCAVI